MDRIKKILPTSIIFLLLAISFFFADGLNVISYPPKSIHQFRQSDCLAYAKTYYQHNTGLLSPANYNLLGKDGKTASEFPIIYFIVGKISKVIGFHYWVFRGFDFLIYITGLFFLFKCIRIWILDPYLAIFPVVILATTPYYYYYALNFLPNVPAISCSFIALYYMLVYEREQKTKQIVGATFFFVIATLLKPTDGGIIWLAYVLTSCTRYFFDKRPRLLPIFISAAIIASSIMVWYKYVDWYNNQNGNHINLQGIYPWWDMAPTDILWTFLQKIFDYWLKSYQQLYVLYLLIAMMGVFRVKIMAVNKFLRVFTLYVMAGTIMYSVLWFKAFGDHDYYQLALTIPAVFISISFIDLVAKYLPRSTLAKAGVYIGLLSVIVISITHNVRQQRFRYTERLNVNCNDDIYGVESYLRQIGITKDDIVYSVPDGSPNITLAAFGNMGYTSDLFGPNNYKAADCIKNGAKFMIVTDSIYLHKPEYIPYMKKQIGNYKGIYIFDLR